jgi:hypothetical protein
MENFEYLQLEVNYYSAAAGVTAPLDAEGYLVWKGLKNYLDKLKAQGWVMIKETRSQTQQFRTYYLKRPVE